MSLVAFVNNLLISFGIVSWNALELYWRGNNDNLRKWEHCCSWCMKPYISPLHILTQHCASSGRPFFVQAITSKIISWTCKNLPSERSCIRKTVKYDVWAEPILIKIFQTKNLYEESDFVSWQNCGICCLCIACQADFSLSCLWELEEGRYECPTLFSSSF